MSMSQANASLLIDVAAETSRLGVTLTQAEQIVTQSANRMGKQVDDGLGDALEKIGQRVKGALVMGVAFQGIDRSIRSAIDSIKAGGTFTEAGVAFGEGIADGLRSVPIAGSIGGALADSALYGLMKVKDQIPDIFKDVAAGIAGPGLFSQFFDGLDAMEMEAKQVQSRIDARANFVAQERQRQIRIGSELSQLQAEQGKYTADPIRSMMSTMANAGIQTADTALGSFRFGLGGAGDVSRNIYEAAQDQVRLLDRIRELQEDLNNSLKATN